MSDSKEGGGRDGRGRVGRGVPGPGCLDFGVRGLGDRCFAAAKAARHPVKGDILKRGLQPVQLHIAHTITITSRHT